MSISILLYSEYEKKSLDNQIIISKVYQLSFDSYMILF
jgi:hypothetical protein